MLIGIAVALLVIPITTIVYSSLNGRIDTDEYKRGIITEGEDLNAADRFLSTTTLEEFENVKLTSPNHISIQLHLVISSEYGVKTNYPNGEGLSYQIDEKGTLHIAPQDDGTYFYNIYLYAPNIKHIEVENIQINELYSEQDSLNLVLNNCKYSKETMLAENPNLSYLHLTLNKSDWTMGGSDPMFERLKMVRLDLDSSSVSLESEHYSQIIVDAKDSQFQLNPPDDTNPTIGTLRINTFGKSTVSLEGDIKIDSLSGSISDSTMVKLPYYMTDNLVKR